MTTSPRDAAKKLAEEFDIDMTDERSKDSQATRLVRYADEAEFWHTPNWETYATVNVKDHSENWPTGSRYFRDWLSRKFYLENGTVPSSQAMQDALATIRGRAQFDGEEHRLHTRIGGHNSDIYLDLCNGDWEVIRITKSGWEFVTDVPIKFRRVRGMLALPHPSTLGDLGALRKFVNLGSTQDWILLQAWIVQAMMPNGPYPILPIHGVQGSAKSTLARILRYIIDPSTAPLRSQPRDERDLVIAANNSWIVALDNLSSLSIWVSDALCRLATGGGFSTRELYSNDDELLIDVQRPVLINGIDDLATRGDLVDRSIQLVLSAIEGEDRITESALWAMIEAARPGILTGLLDAVCGVLRHRDDIDLKRFPRMADFAVTAVAMERALGWESGTFMMAYDRNIASANDTVIDSSPVAISLMAADLSVPWNGTATKLLTKLNDSVQDSVKQSKGWPKNGNGFSNVLRRLAPNMKRAGIQIDFDNPSRRMLLIRKGTQNSVSSDTTSKEVRQVHVTGVSGLDAGGVNHVTSVTPGLAGDTGMKGVAHDAVDANDAGIHGVSRGAVNRRKEQL